MSEYPPEAWRTLSRLLKARRVRIDTRYRNRTVFCQETGLHYKLVQDMENAPETRTNFTDESFVLFEEAYRLAEGSIRRTLKTGHLETLATGGPRPEEQPASPETPEPLSEEPDSVITPNLVALLQQANERLAELSRKVDEQGRKLDEQNQRMEEWRRDNNGPQRKGA